MNCCGCVGSEMRAHITVHVLTLSQQGCMYDVRHKKHTLCAINLELYEALSHDNS